MAVLEQVQCVCRSYGCGEISHHGREGLIEAVPHLGDHVIANKGADGDGANGKVVGGLDHDTGALLDGHGH